MPSIPDLAAQSAIPAQPAVPAQPATATQTAQKAQPATPAIPARKWGSKVPWGAIGFAILAAVVGYLVGSGSRDQMLTEFMVSKFFFLVPMTVGILEFWWVLRWMSMSTGVPWSEVYAELKKGNMAMAFYYGMRLLVIGLVVVGLAIAGTSV